MKNITIVFSPLNNIKKITRSVKDPIDVRLQKGVYQIPCTCGKTYIGEMRRFIQKRIKEHSVDIYLIRIHK
jgi:hypothetical protein